MFGYILSFGPNDLLFDPEEKDRLVQEGKLFHCIPFYLKENLMILSK